MNATANDRTAPKIPVEPRAAPPEALKALRVRARLKAIAYGVEILLLVVCAVALAWPDILKIALATNLDPAQRMGAVVRSSAIAVLTLLVATWLAARACGAWTRHSPLRTDGLWALDEIAEDNFMQQFTWSARAVNRFRNDVSMMERSFTQHDLEQLAAYRNRVISYRSDLRDWKFAQEEKDRISGNERAASAATQALITRAKRGRPSE
ncbi:hypothetical protein BLA39750_01102 [Burkholderia lata]|uniref:Uncharacterized protein n=1 Tax=Burkholderia lata (strain ATCC 17760 / DSM 23089 / LMG 22485 / NCIMB 9086 / R18194 / 383) TaxID=482957 RepID=A0A6P2UR78_BURL3|nr:hypothetical protein [Burkholderia lata]VWC79676.1 hypothetical protein BLA39750_01102 [Burkholderia lata]